MTPELAQAVLVEATRRDFPTFLCRAFAELHQGRTLEVRWPLEAVAARLQGVGNGGGRLIINMPPRSLKSVTVSVAWVAWMLGRDPGLKFVCISYAAELALKHARDCRLLLTADWYRQAFPQTRLARNAENDLVTTARGGRFSTSIEGSLTGLGGDFIVIDDPLKPGEASSAAARTAVNEWYATTLASRLDDKQRGSIVLVMQRVHEDDLTGRLLEGGDWDHLRLPAVADEDVIVPLLGRRTHVRRAGDMLDPEREPFDSLQKTRAQLGSAVFEAQYQQNPLPAAGTLIKREWLRTYSREPVRGPGDRIVQSWDCASKTGVINDFSVCVTALVRGRSIFIIDVFRQRLDFPALLKATIRLAQDHRCEQLLIEEAASGQQLIQVLRAEAPAGVPRPISITPQGDKITRLSAASARIENGELLLPAAATWLAELEREVLGFPNAKYDDQADALAQLINHEIRRPEPSLPGGSYAYIDGQLCEELDLEPDGEVNMY